MHWLEVYYPRAIGSTIMGPNWILFITDLMRKVGMPERLMPYLLAQVAHESDGGRSILANTWHNWSGIKANKHGLANGATPNGFATYANDGKWASDYKRVLSMNPGRPIDATSAQDFYLRLLKNGYFTKGESAAYAAAFNNRLKEVNVILADKSGDLKDAVANNQDATNSKKDLGPVDRHNSKKGFAKEHPVLMGVGMAVAGVIVIKALNS